jgi:hypothetical protein
LQDAANPAAAYREDLGRRQPDRDDVYAWRAYLSDELRSLFEKSLQDAVE